MRVTVQTVGADWKPETWTKTYANLDRDLNDLLRRWATRLADEVRRVAPKDHGDLARSVRGRFDKLTKEISIIVGAPYAILQELGTGIYSENPESPKQLIVPKNARALKIPIGRVRSFQDVPLEAQAFDVRAVRHGKKGQLTTRAGTASIFRMSVRGVKPLHFVRDTMARYEEMIFRDVAELLTRYGFG